MIHVRFAENLPPLFQRRTLPRSERIPICPPVKFLASMFQHGLRLGTQSLGDRAVIGERKLVQKRVRA